MKRFFLTLFLLSLFSTQARAEYKNSVGGMISPIAVGLEYSLLNEENSGPTLRALGESYLVLGYAGVFAGYRFNLVRGLFVTPAIGYSKYEDIVDDKREGYVGQFTIGYDWMLESGLYLGVEAGAVQLPGEGFGAQLPKFRIGFHF